MSRNSSDPHSERLNQIIAEFLEAIASGKEPDRNELIRQYPDLADDLKSFLADHDQMKAARNGSQTPSLPPNPSALEAATIPPSEPTAAGGEDVTLPPRPLGSDNASELTTQVGAKIRYFGDYELLEEIARGGMGVVYKARQINLNRIVALKMILAGQLASEDDVKRFYTEAEAAANLDHPGIVPIFEVGQHEGQHYFSMGFIEGESLADRLKDGPLPPREAAEYTKKVAEAIGFAHERGVIHRDLKPANVLLDRDDQPKVTDFGLAKKTEADSNLTGTGQILGTPSYMPPEQASGRINEVAETADVYSLGAILYALVTGRPPFQADNPLDTLLLVLEQDPVSPRILNPKVPPDLETVCIKCLEKDRSRRYASAQALVEELERFLNGEPIVARPISRVERAWRWCKRKPVVAGLWATAVLLLLTLSVGGPIVGLQQKRIAEQQTAFASEQNRLRLQAEEAREEEKLQRTRTEQMLYAAQIASAQREWELRNVDAAREHLDACRWDLRGWEHDYLQTLFTNHIKTIVGHDHPVTSAAFSPDGRRIVAGSGGRLLFGRPGELKVWDVAKGREELNLKGHKGAISSVAFSPDGSRIVSGSHDMTLKVWDAKTGQQTSNLTGHTGPVRSVAFSPDGSRIVSGSEDKKLILWDAVTGEKDLTLTGHASPVTSVAFSPDGRRIVSGGGNHEQVGPPGELSVWDVTTGQRTWTQLRPGAAVTSVAFSPDGQRIVSSGGCFGESLTGDGRSVELTIWEASAGEEVLMLKGHTNVVWNAAFSPDGRQIVSVSQDQTLKLWDATTGGETLVVRGSTASQAACVAYSPDGQRIAIGGHGGSGISGELRLWNLTTKPETASFDVQDCYVSSVAFSPDGQQVIGATGDYRKPDQPGELRIWDLATGQESVKIPAQDPSVYLVGFSPDGRHVVSAARFLRKPDQPGELKVWDLATAQETFRLPVEGGLVSSVAFSPDGQRIVASSFNPTKADQSGAIDIWDPTKAEQSGTIQVWDAKTGRQTGAFAGHEGVVFSVAFSPDGRRLVSGGVASTADGRRGELIVWDLATGQRSLNLKGHSQGVRSAAFCADGQRIVSAALPAKSTGSGEIKVWDAGTGEETCNSDWMLQGHGRSVSSVAISPDGRRIVSAAFMGDRPGEVKVWSVDTGVETMTLRGHTQDVRSVAFSSDGRRIASAGGLSSGQVKVWEATAHRESLTNTKPATAGAESRGPAPANRPIAARGDSTPSTEESPKAASSSKSLTIRKGVASATKCVVFSPDGRRIATGSNDKTVRVWDATTGQETLTLIGHSLYITSLAFSPDGGRIVSGGSGRSGEIKVWDAETGKEVPFFQGDVGPVTAVAFSPDGRWIASGGMGIKVWDAKTGRETVTLAVLHAMCLAFSPDGRRIVASAMGNTPQVWDAQTGKKLFSLKGHAGFVPSVSFSPDGQRIVSGAHDKTLKLWDAKSGQETATLAGHTSSVLCVAFSPDGRRIVSGAADKTLKLWDATTGREVSTLTGHTSMVYGVAFGPNAKRVASVGGGFDPTIRIWEIPDSENGK